MKAPSSAPFNTYIELFVKGHLHNQGLQVDHTAGDIKLFDDFFKNQVFFFWCRDNQGVGLWICGYLQICGQGRCLGCLCLGAFGRCSCLLGRQAGQDRDQLFGISVLEVINMDFAATFGSLGIQLLQDTAKFFIWALGAKTIREFVRS